MAQYSYYWGGTTVGDATLAPYNDDEFSDNWALLFTYDRTVQGIIGTEHPSYSGQLACTNPAGTTIRVANGAALVDGKLYLNTANVDFSISAPGAGTNYYVIVLRKDFAAQTVRLAILGPSNVAFPAPTQNDGVLWEIQVQGVEITNAGVITISEQDGRVCISPLLLKQSGTALVASLSGDARGYYANDLQRHRALDSEVASADYSVISGGRENTADGEYSVVSGGMQNTATGNFSYAEGFANVSSGAYSHSEGAANEASGDYSHAEGTGTTASSDYSHAEGAATTTGGDASHAEGASSTASGDASHAEGAATLASATAAHAEGGSSIASGLYSHAEGFETEATGVACHAEGNNTHSLAAFGSHAEGFESEANGNYSHAGGYGGTTTQWCQFSRSGSGSYLMQYSDYHLGLTKTHSDANWYQLYLDGVSIQMLVTIDSVMTFDALIVGTTQCDAAPPPRTKKSFSYRIEGAIENNGGVTTLLASTVTTIYETDDTDFAARATADDANDALLIEVQDATSGGDTVRWSAIVRCAEASFHS